MGRSYGTHQLLQPVCHCEERGITLRKLQDEIPRSSQ